jgi:hypothetical protein
MTIFHYISGDQLHTAFQQISQLLQGTKDHTDLSSIQLQGVGRCGDENFHVHVLLIRDAQGLLDSFCVTVIDGPLPDPKVKKEQLSAKKLDNDALPPIQVVDIVPNSSKKISARRRLLTGIPSWIHLPCSWLHKEIF